MVKNFNHAGICNTAIVTLLHMAGYKVYWSDGSQIVARVKGLLISVKKNSQL